jgi:hypothetical protein
MGDNEKISRLVRHIIKYIPHTAADRLENASPQESWLIGFIIRTIRDHVKTDVISSIMNQDQDRYDICIRWSSQKPISFGLFESIVKISPVDILEISVVATDKPIHTLQQQQEHEAEEQQQQQFHKYTLLPSTNTKCSNGFVITVTIKRVKDHDTRGENLEANVKRKHNDTFINVLKSNNKRKYTDSFDGDDYDDNHSIVLKEIIGKLDLKKYTDSLSRAVNEKEVDFFIRKTLSIIVNNSSYLGDDKAEHTVDVSVYENKGGGGFWIVVMGIKRVKYALLEQLMVNLAPRMSEVAIFSQATSLTVHVGISSLPIKRNSPSVYYVPRNVTK